MTLYAPSNRTRKKDGTYAPDPLVVSRYQPLPPATQPSLPTVSILDRDLDLTDADYRAGLQAMREAGQ